MKSASWRKHSSSSCHQKTDLSVFLCVAASHCKSVFYKDQCISSKSTASPKFVSVSRRLIITAMAASSLLRLLRPGPTTLSKSSCEFSPAVRWGDKEREKKKNTKRLWALTTRFQEEIHHSSLHVPTWAFINELINRIRESTHERFSSWECSSRRIILWAGLFWHLHVCCLSIWHLRPKRKKL